MKKIYFFVIIFLSITKISVAQVYTWNGSASTDYQNAANWTPARTTISTTDTLSFDAGTTINVANVASQTIGAIQIASGTSPVIFSTNIPTNVLMLSAVKPLIYNSAGTILAGDFLTIQLNNTSNFTISSGVFGIAPGRGGKVRINGTLTLAGGTLDLDVAGTGGTTISGPTGSITYKSGIFSSSRAASITWGAGSNYYHATDGSVASPIPAASWQTGATCNITGMQAGNIAPTGFAGIIFSNLTWNCPLQNGNIVLLPSGTAVNINTMLSVISTGAAGQALQLSNGKATVKAGQYNQTGGSLSLESGADTTILGISGNFSHTGGILNGVSGGAAGTAIVDLKGNVTFGGTASWQCTGSNTGAQVIYQFSGTVAQAVNVAAGTWSQPVAGRCNVVISNTEIINGVNLTGALRVYNTGSAVLPATLMMNGVITDAGGSVTYTGSGAGGSTLIYSGSFFQTASAIEFPASGGPLNLTINNKLGISFPTNFNRTLNGRLFLQSGNLAIGNGDTLSLVNSSLANQLSYTNGFITTGTLGRYFPTTGLPTSAGTNSLFPFGSGVNSRFLNVFFSSASLTGGTAGMIYVNHTAIVDAVPISLTDNNNVPITLDKRTNTNWIIATGAFNIGGGGVTVSVTAAGTNIGAVNSFTYLRLTDGITPNFGTLIPTTGSNSAPVVGKSGLSQTGLNRTLYVGSDVHNPLIVITFTWTGLGGNSNWTTPANWTGGVGYPSASTERAIISTTSGSQPSLVAGTTVEIYQLRLDAGMSLTMTGNATINVFDSVNFKGTAIFAPTSTFGYSSSNNAQEIPDIPYGSFALSGTAPKILPATLTITGAYTVTGVSPNTTANDNNFVYAGTGAQFITPASYYNLTITGDRGGQLITLVGSNPNQNIIDIQNIFSVSGLSNYTVAATGNVVNFSYTGAQTIPGFYYNNITNTGNGPRTLDPLGSADPAHVITTRTFSRGSGIYTIDNSKVKFYVSGTVNTGYIGSDYYDLEITGNLNGHTLNFFNGTRFSIAGKFNLSVTNFVQGTNVFNFNFNGNGDQTITAFSPDVATNTPAFKYNDVYITGGNRNVILAGGSDTIAITGTLTPERNGRSGIAAPFAAGKGFVVSGSTVNFSIAGSGIPVLKPLTTGGSNYNNVIVSSGNRIIGSDMIMGGDLTVLGTDTELPANLTVVSGKILTILGNLSW